MKKNFRIDSSFRLLPVLAYTFLSASIATPIAAATLTAASVAEFQTALGKVQPGDVIVLKSGTWNNSPLDFKAEGAEGNPITVRAEEPGKVIFTGTSNFTFTGSWLVADGLNYQGAKSSTPMVIFDNGSNHCRFTNSAVVNCNAPDRWIHFRTGTNNRFDHNYVSGMNQAGQTVQVEVDPNIPNYHLLDDNFFGNRPQGNGNGFETFRIGYSGQQFNSSRTTVQRNLFSKCDGENEIISSKSCDNRYLYNTFMNSRGHLSNRHGSRAWIEGNFFIGCAGGVRVIDSGHTVINNYFEGLSDFGIMIYRGVNTADLKSYKQVVGGLIAFNTMINCGITIGGGSGTLLPRDVKIANNLAYGSGTFAQNAGTPINFTYEGNMGNQKGGDAPGFVTKDPMMTKGTDGIYRPSSSSPAKGAAVGNYPEITMDMNGLTRANPKDVGAMLIGSDGKVHVPLTEKDVGPYWMGNMTPDSEVVAINPIRSGAYGSADPHRQVFGPSDQMNLLRAHASLPSGLILNDMLGRGVRGTVASGALVLAPENGNAAQGRRIILPW